LRIDRLMSFGLAWSIRKVMEARRMVDAGGLDQWDHPACQSPCRTHLTVWVCFETTPAERKHAADKLEFRKGLFPLGIIETRDSVVLVVKTPRPVELTAGVCDPTKMISDGGEPLYKEPVIVTQAFTSNDEPRWTQPTSTASSVLQAATLHEV